MRFVYPSTVSHSTLDTGALIPADNNDRAFWAFFKDASEQQMVPVISAPVLAQAWRSPAGRAWPSW